MSLQIPEADLPDALLAPKLAYREKQQGKIGCCIFCGVLSSSNDVDWEVDILKRVACFTFLVKAALRMATFALSKENMRVRSAGRDR